MTRNLSTGLALLALLVIYSLSNQAGSWLIERQYGVGCSISFLSLSCAYPADSGFNDLAYALLGGTLIVSVVAARLWWREHVVGPFIQLMGLIGLAAIGWDVLMQLPVLNSAKIINDTENILSFVIFGSFVLMLAILRKRRVGLGTFVVASLVSYAVKIVMMMVFLDISGNVMGATELYLLYVAYAFGTFTVHIMTVSGIVTGVAMPRLEAAE
ncbi:MAG: hypothetical protein H7316_04970 [Tardiphaga sp.]|uniref:hypothetical protein n=1 Tax=Tardiphaga sp. TaxID=1926292 RepID=UPI0019893244|nr:hypothetical protein [Tardiphaga sp.]MBC7583081.1 hypothetical protein [Tardiphaga sp.]